jgi:hypothetical protein
VEWLKVKALSSNPSTTKKKKKEKKETVLVALVAYKYKRWKMVYHENH